jgi:Amt family ammonium transporter
VTPAAGFIGPMGALLLGAVAALPSYYALVRRSRTRLDDSLDVVGAHGVGGMVGALLTGVLARAAWGGSSGLLDGNPRQLAVQAAGVAAVALYSGLVSFALLRVIGMLAPLRADSRAEGTGLDVLEHGEAAYASGEGAILILPDAAGTAFHRTPVGLSAAESAAGRH